MSGAALRWETRTAPKVWVSLPHHVHKAHDHQSIGKACAPIFIWLEFWINPLNILIGPVPRPIIGPLGGGGEALSTVKYSRLSRVLEVVLSRWYPACGEKFGCVKRDWKWQADIIRNDQLFQLPEGWDLWKKHLPPEKHRHLQHWCPCACPSLCLFDDEYFGGWFGIMGRLQKDVNYDN